MLYFLENDQNWKDVTIHLSGENKCVDLSEIWRNEDKDWGTVLGYYYSDQKHECWYNNDTKENR